MSYKTVYERNCNQRYQYPKPVGVVIVLTETDFVRMRI